MTMSVTNPSPSVPLGYSDCIVSPEGLEWLLSKADYLAVVGTTTLKPFCFCSLLTGIQDRRRSDPRVEKPQISLKAAEEYWASKRARLSRPILGALPVGHNHSVRPPTPSLNDQGNEECGAVVASGFCWEIAGPSYSDHALAKRKTYSISHDTYSWQSDG
jgi:hypothetical protein